MANKLAGGTRKCLRRRVINHWWVNLRQRRCAYCSCQLHFTHQHSQQATVEHIIPMSKGGAKLKTHNTLLVCLSCNRKRGNKPFESFVKGLPREYWLIEKYKGAVL